jgi:hypothetical protein
MDVETQVTGADELTRGLREMAERAQDLRPLFEGEIAELWRDRQKAVFSSGKLAPLSPRSVKRKRRNKNVPLVDTGELRDLTYKYTPVKTTTDSAKFGIPKGSGSVSGRGRKSIGAMHAVKSGSRPRRDAVPSWTAAERRRILEMFSEYMMGRP